MKTVEQAREALDRQWNRHIVGMFGPAREITTAIDDLIDAKIAAARKPLPPYDGWRVGQAAAPEDTAKGGERWPAGDYRMMSSSDLIAVIAEKDRRIAELERALHEAYQDLGAPDRAALADEVKP